MKIAVMLDTVHTHTHTHTQVNLIKIKKALLANALLMIDLDG